MDNDAAARCVDCAGVYLCEVLRASNTVSEHDTGLPIDCAQQSVALSCIDCVRVAERDTTTELTVHMHAWRN